MAAASHGGCGCRATLTAKARSRRSSTASCLSVPRRAATQLAVTTEAEPAAAAEGAYTVRLEVPGVRTDDLRIVVQGGELSVTGESERAGFRYRVDRTFELPRDADEGAMSANHVDGVLTLSVSKLAPPAAKKITIESAVPVAAAPAAAAAA